MMLIVLIFMLVSIIAVGFLVLPTPAMLSLMVIACIPALVIAVQVHHDYGVWIFDPRTWKEDKS